MPLYKREDLWKTSERWTSSTALQEADRIEMIWKDLLGKKSWTVQDWQRLYLHDCQHFTYLAGRVSKDKQADQRLKGKSLKMKEELEKIYTEAKKLQRFNSISIKEVYYDQDDDDTAINLIDEQDT